MSIQIVYFVLVDLTLLHVFRMKSVAFLSDMPLSHYCQKANGDMTTSGFRNEDPEAHLLQSPSWTSGRNAELPTLPLGAYLFAGP